MRKSQIGLLAATVALLALAACSHVGADWKQAQQADTPEAYQECLRLHADSEFSVRAQERIKQLAEDRDWQAASAADSLDAYQQFVATHADGKWAQEARVRIENFQLGTQPAAGTAGGAAPGASSAAGGSPAPLSPVPAKPAPAPTAPVAAAKPATKPAAAARAPAAKSPPPAHKPAASAKAARGTHLAQLGAFGSRASAVAAWEKLSARYGSELGALQPRYSSGKSGGKPVVRLQVRVGSVQQVRELCTKLKHHKQPCVAVG
jgi:cell division septation protein DedD